MGYMTYDPRKREFQKPFAKYLEDYKRCRTCLHGGSLAGGLHEDTILVPCFYIINTGHPRPCAPGKQCTVYEPLKEAEK